MLRRFGLVLLALMAPAICAAQGWPSLAQVHGIAGGGDRDAAVIVGIERYLVVSPVAGAAQNANDWFEYLVRSRGVPVQNVELLRDNQATREALEGAAARAATRVGRGGTLWFVFIGHGAPSKSGDDGMLVGVDAQQTPLSLYARSVSQRSLVRTLVGGRQKETVVVVDACFSGKTPDGAALATGLQPLIVTTPKVARKATVLSAGTSDQFAGPLSGEARPAFSYLVLGALRGWGDSDRNRRVTVEEAWDYARTALQATVRGRNQTPTYTGSAKLVLADGATELGPDLVSIVKNAGQASPPPATYRPAPQPQTRNVPPGYIGGGDRDHWAKGAAISGFVMSGLALTLGTAAGVVSDGGDRFGAIGLGGAATVILAVGGPVVNAGSGSARDLGARGVKGLRIAGWIGYGVTMGLAVVQLGMGVANVNVPSGFIYGTTGLGTVSLVAFSIDSIVASGQANRGSLSEGADGLGLRPIFTVSRDADGGTGGFLGLGGSF